MLWITQFDMQNDWLHKSNRLHGNEESLEESGHTMRRIFMHLRECTKLAVSRQGKSFKEWFMLDLHFIITYYSTNYPKNDTACGKS